MKNTNLGMRFKNILIAGLSIFLTSCFLDKEFCDRMTKITNEEDYQIILSEYPYKTSRGGEFHYLLQGKDLQTSNDTLIKLLNHRWTESFDFFWSVGDTIIKHKDSMITEIHSKDTIYYMKWDCDNRLINGMTIDQVTQTLHFLKLKEDYYKRTR
ncbi:hypothetical protein [Myroides odoratimimus]|uniref:hypothetical protein n=1 Tax=Myroides odoratimimus TaxID=76832 RepID=UPI00310180B7